MVLLSEVQLLGFMRQQRKSLFVLWTEFLEISHSAPNELDHMPPGSGQSGTDIGNRIMKTELQKNWATDVSYEGPHQYQCGTCILLIEVLGC